MFMLFSIEEALTKSHWKRNLWSDGKLLSSPWWVSNTMAPCTKRPLHASLPWYDDTDDQVWSPRGEVVGPQNGVTVDQGGRYIISSISSTHTYVFQTYILKFLWKIWNIAAYCFFFIAWQETWWFTAYCTILPWRVVNVIPLWGAVSAIRLRESFLTTGIWRVSDGNQWFFFSPLFWFSCQNIYPSSFDKLTGRLVKLSMILRFLSFPR